MAGGECGNQQDGGTGMKLVEQYLEVVARKLPYKGRQDLKAELKSLLLDEIEARYGSDPTEEQLKSALKDFGAPEAVARRYHDQQGIIASGLVPFYFFLLKLVLGALALAFFVLFILGQVQIELDASTSGGVSLLTLAKGLGTFVLTTLNAYFAAVGVMTLGFIAASRSGKVNPVDLEDDWTAEELKDVEIGPQNVSRIGSIVSLVFLSVLIILMNFFPQIVSLAEDLFQRSTLVLGHRLDVSLFRIYMHVMTLAWIMEVLHHGLLLARGSVTKAAKLLEWLAAGTGFIILVALVSDSRIYLFYEGLLGFRLMFVILLCIGIAELASLAWKALYERLGKGTRI
jgi:hypothetical protein